MRGGRFNSQKCIYRILCVSPKKRRRERELITALFVNVSSDLFTGVHVSSMATGRVACGYRRFWERKCVDASSIDVQLTSRGRATVKSGECRYWCDRRGDLSLVRSIFDTSGQKSHNCGCNIDDVSPDNGVTG